MSGKEIEKVMIPAEITLGTKVFNRVLNQHGICISNYDGFFAAIGLIEIQCDQSNEYGLPMYSMWEAKNCEIVKDG